MSKTSTAASTRPAIELKDPPMAALLAFLVPGLGHLYQGRTAKGIVFLVAILGTYGYGLFLGGPHVVYASWRPEDRRLPYLCQVGAGLPALPALVQSYRVRNGKEPLFGGFMAPPKVRHPDAMFADELDKIHFDLNRRYELGTVYTMVAGLLNLLVIYDAWGGPMFIEDEKRKRRAIAKGNRALAKDKSPEDQDEKPKPVDTA